uniref:signal peptide peptidase SppA n=1 Tax=Thaumasiovibrio occultus TaxID=1891184 RepID=UPI000B354D05|nr:signal peptide peptidase SppA [Thaumasiovibrio occultus]
MGMIFSGIRKIFRWLWRGVNFLRNLLINLFFFGSVALFFLIVTQEVERTVPVIEPNSALILDLSGKIVEQRTVTSPFDTLSQSVFGNSQPRENVLFDIVDAIRQAEQDKRITGIVLQLSKMSDVSLTQLQYIGKALAEFSDSGKPIYAYGEIFTQSQYYLASYADEVLMSPDGGVMLTGFSTYRLYYKSLFDKLDVNTHVFRVGTYKSAIEPYTRDGMSDAARESNQVWLDQLWGAYVLDVADNRNVDPDVLSPDIDTLLAEMRAVNGDFAQYSLKQGLVDQLATRQEMQNRLIDRFGSDLNGGYKSVSYYNYHVFPELISDKNGDPHAVPNEIAVVVASGPIVDGEYRQGTVSGDATANLLRQARDDDAVKAVILRVNSPGGSAFASEVIRNEVDAVRAAGKPVVVSMSATAASGGYWISASADAIVANPSTLTGSIGIFGLLTTFEDTLANWGVYTDGVGTTALSGVGLTRELEPKVAELFQLGIEAGYQRFISLVAEYRDMTLEEADSVAQGRVWTGKDAHSLGLVDHLGDFDVAVETASRLAGIKSYQLNWMERELTPMEEFLDGLSHSVAAPLAQPLADALAPQWSAPLREVQAAIVELDTLNDPKGQMAYCLNCLNIN